MAAEAKEAVQALQCSKYVRDTAEGMQMDVVMVWTKHRNHYKWLLDANVKLDTIVADLANMKANMKCTMIFTGGFLFVMVVFLYTNAMRKAEANFAKSYDQPVCQDHHLDETVE